MYYVLYLEVYIGVFISPVLKVFSTSNIEYGKRYLLNYNDILLEKKKKKCYLKLVLIQNYDNCFQLRSYKAFLNYFLHIILYSLYYLKEPRK